jgi:hypothetical protein
MDLLKGWLSPLIETFEAQSAQGDGIFTDSTIAVIRNISDFPEPEARPLSSSPANVDFVKESRAEAKRESKVP